MKGLRVVIVTVLIAGALQACNNRHPQNYNTTPWPRTAMATLPPTQPANCTW
jgi:hypothetical protein